jgi:hypothetical protein
MSTFFMRRQTFGIYSHNIAPPLQETQLLSEAHVVDTQNRNYLSYPFT